MKLPNDDRERAIVEQCWLGIGFMLFWAVLIMGLFKACTHGGEVRVFWDAPPAAQKVTSWRIYRGIELLATVTEPRAVLTVPDETVSLTLTAINSTGESDHTPPLTLFPITIQASTDLKTWTPLRVIHRSRRPQEFFRLKIEP